MNEKKKKGSFGDFLRTLIMLIALGVFCYSGYMLFTFYRAYKQGSDEYDNLEANYSAQQEPETGLSMEDLEDDAVMEAVGEQLEAMNASDSLPQWASEISVPGAAGTLDFEAGSWEDAESAAQNAGNTQAIRKGKIISREGVIGEDGVLFNQTVTETEILEGSREGTPAGEQEPGEEASASETDVQTSGFGSILAGQGQNGRTQTSPQQTDSHVENSGPDSEYADSGSGSESADSGLTLELESDMNISSVASAAAKGILNTSRMIPVWENGSVKWYPVLKNPVDFDDLISINSDICGWLKIRALDISYPVVQGEDNDYYLHRTFEKTDNFAGCIFMDAANQEDFSDQNTVLYGHNMKNGSMFGKLNWLREKETYEKSKFFWVFSQDLIWQYRIISGMVVNKSGEFYMNVYTEEEYEKHLINAMKHSELDNDGVTVCTSDRIVTLSTCTGDDATRFVVLGKLQQTYVSENRAEQMRRRFLEGPPEPETETEWSSEGDELWSSGMTWEEMSESLPVIVVG